MLKATVRVGGGVEASLNRIYLIQEVLKNIKNGVPLFEILHIRAIFSVPGFAFLFTRWWKHAVNSETCFH